MNDARLPPKNFHFSLPALTAAEAEAILDLVDTIQQLLWEAYGDHVFDLYADRGPEDDLAGSDPNDGPDF